MATIQSLADAMNANTGAVPNREVITDPVTLESVQNGAKVTVQRNSIAHYELAQGKAGALVRVAKNTGPSVPVGVSFNSDGVIQGREQAHAAKIAERPAEAVTAAEEALNAELLDTQAKLQAQEQAMRAMQETIARLEAANAAAAKPAAPPAATVKKREVNPTPPASPDAPWAAKAV